MADRFIGSVLAGQRITAVAGTGGMGVVYRATDLALDREVALKVVAPALAGDPAFRQRFIAESKLAASLDHPNVIPIYRAGEEDGVLFIVMRLVNGDDLRSALLRDGPFEPQRAARIIAQVASALDAAHASGLVYRDVKPANIMLGAGDHAYLTDFGLSKRAGVSGDDTRTGNVLGTIKYVAPEQIRGGPVDARTDVYALGGVLFCMLTGRAPFNLDTDEGTLWAHLSAPPPSASRVQPGVPSAVDAVIARAMAKDPALRHPDAGSLGRDALAAIGGGEDETRTSSRASDDRAAPAAAAPEPRAPAGDTPQAASSISRPYTRTTHRRALVLNAAVDPTGIVAAAVVIAGGLWFGALPLALPVAIAFYALGTLRAFLDEDVTKRVLERERAKRRRKQLRARHSGTSSVLSEDLRALVDRAEAIRTRIDDAIRRSDLRDYGNVAAEVDHLVDTMERTAGRAQLLHDGLQDTPAAAVAARLATVRARADPSQADLVSALSNQLAVHRRMEQQLARFNDEMERMLVELDTVRANLLSVSASQGADEQRRIARGVREMRDQMGAVADDMATAYSGRSDLSGALDELAADA
ncbi:MAG: hypothetical protein QOE28_545 [Solirubrobacteraceae bacterium]|nr:hypothetical protein [Solirubrobacteraceae bacterium]